MPVPNPMPLMAKNGMINIWGKLSELTATIPIIAETAIKHKAIRRLFNNILNFL